MKIEIYIIPVLISALCFFLTISIGKVKQKNITLAQPFKNHTSNNLYTLSYSKGFSSFVHSNPKHKDVVKINSLIAEAGQSHQMDYRVFSVIRIICLMIGLGLTLLTFIGTEWVFTIIKFLFNIHVTIDNVSSESQLQFFTLILGVSLYYIPLLILKSNAKKRRFKFIKDLPVLQLFITQMLRSHNPISQVLYLMSKIDTQYKEIFAISYRIYMRNTEEGLAYLKSSFKGTKFEETVAILQDYGQYANEESIITLEHIRKDIQNQVEHINKSKAVTKLLASQGAIAIPFISIIALTFIPIIIYGNSLMSSAQFTM